MDPPLLRRPIGRAGLLLSLTLVGGSAGLLYGVKAPPTFTARAYVVVAGLPAAGTSLAEPGPSAAGTSQAAADASVPMAAGGVSMAAAGWRPDAVAYAHVYGRIATSRPVLAQATALLGTDLNSLDDVRASTRPDAPVIEIAASARSAARAASVANAVAGALVADGRSQLHVALAATAPAHPSSPDPPCELVIGTSAGLLTGALAALASLLTARRPRRLGASPRQPGPPPGRPASRPALVDPAEIEGHLGIWRARSSTSSRSA
jgi:hypothetical protein